MPGTVNPDTDRSDASGYRQMEYSIGCYQEDLRDWESFSEEERDMLRPIAETFAMLDGNAFFGTELRDGHEWYEQYLPEAYCLFKNNGGMTGWAGEVSWLKGAHQDNPAVKEAWESYLTLRRLAKT